jgi:hypothetical protein
MSGDLTRLSDRLIEDARRVRDDNRMGGRHRRDRSIGRGSVRLKVRHWVKKLMRTALAVFTVLFAAAVAGIIGGGIGFLGILLTFLAVIVATAVFLTFPRMKPPRRADLNRGNVKQMVGRTELWLEHQRAALPPPAIAVVDDLGVQLDELGLQLQTVDQSHPQVREIRKLVGEILPETVDSYKAIPAHLRREERAGTTPERQVTESLEKISAEIGSITRQLAEGSLDDLAIKHRYLGTRYGPDGGMETG